MLVPPAPAGPAAPVPSLLARTPAYASTASRGVVRAPHRDAQHDAQDDAQQDDAQQDAQHDRSRGADLVPAGGGAYSTRMAESPVHLLRLHARHAPFNARSLAAHATALVDAAGIRPTNASARAAPSARAVRFYVASGLLDRPEGAGTSATYNYRHLLQLLGIKIRQREGQTLDAIKREMREVSGDALERRVATSLAPALAMGGASEASASQRDGEPAGWRRLLVIDGIELHVRADVPAARDEVLLAMREAVRAAIGRGELRT